MKNSTQGLMKSLYVKIQEPLYIEVFCTSKNVYEQQQQHHKLGDHILKYLMLK